MVSASTLTRRSCPTWWWPRERPAVAPCTATHLGHPVPGRGDAAYNNNAAVPDSAAWVAARDVAAAAYRAAHSAALDLAFGPGDRQAGPVRGDAGRAVPGVSAWRLLAAQLARGVRALCGGPARPRLVGGAAQLFAGATGRLSDIVDEIRMALDFLAGQKAALGLTGPLVLSGYRSFPGHSWR